MAGRRKGTNNSSGTPARKTNQRTRRSRTENRELYGELCALAAAQGAEHIARAAGVTAPQIMQELLERATAHWRYATAKVDDLPPEKFWRAKTDAHGNHLVEPHPWYKLEQAARAELEDLTAKMVQLGLAERAVQVEEAKAALMVAAVRDAARDAGLSTTDVRKLGAALRARVLAAGEAA
jgi:hypothetical protein